MINIVFLRGVKSSENDIHFKFEFSGSINRSRSTINLSTILPDYFLLNLLLIKSCFCLGSRLRNIGYFTHKKQCMLFVSKSVNIKHQ